MSKKSGREGSQQEITFLPSDKSLGYLLAATQRLHSRVLQVHVAGDEVPAGVWVFLRTLWEEDGLTQRQISQRVNIQEAATGVALEKLERAGLVRRSRNEVDRRKINVSLTEHGRELGQDLLPKIHSLTDRMLVGFEDFEAAQLLSYLVRVRNNLLKITKDTDKPD